MSDECEHLRGGCNHEKQISWCSDCGKVWPFTTCGKTDEEIKRLEKLNYAPN